MATIPSMTCTLIIGRFWQKKIIIVVKKHHFLCLSVLIWLTVIIVCKTSVACGVILILSPVLILAIFLKLFELICVCGSDELSIHVEDLSLWVHQELTVVALNLNSSHDHVVFHVELTCSVSASVFVCPSCSALGCPVFSLLF